MGNDWRIKKKAGECKKGKPRKGRRGREEVERRKTPGRFQGREWKRR